MITKWKLANFKSIQNETKDLLIIKYNIIG